MNRKYYSYREVKKHFEKIGCSFDFEDMCDYVRKRIIHPVIYIDSFPVYAYEKTSMEQASSIIGFCYLSAYWHIDGDNVIAVFDNLLRGIIAKLQSVGKEELTQIVPTSWRTELHYFEEVPIEHLHLKPFSNDLAIIGFMFLTENPFSIRTENIAISEEDLNILSTCITTDLRKMKNSEKIAHARRANGILSGQVRNEVAEKNLQRIKPSLLNIAKNHAPTNANKIATVAVINKIIPKKALSNIAKSIRKDKDFKPFLKKS